MKSYLLLVLSLILYSCGSESSNSENTAEEAEINSSSTEEASKSEEKSLTENDNYSELFSTSVCESFSNERVASILEVPADLLKTQVADYETNITCSWGYYPEDPKNGKNIIINLYDDEYTTDSHYSSDLKSVENSNHVTEVSLNVSPAVIATYRQDRGWLKVYISNSRMIQFQIGPTMQMNDEEKSDLKKIAIKFAKAFLTQ